MISLGAYEYSSNHQNLLGSGSFSYVYRGNVRNRPNELVAIKIMKKDQNKPKSVTLVSKEISVLKDINHDNIVQLYDHGVSNYGVYLVMEYCNGGDLSEYLSAKGTLPEETIRHILIQIGSAMNAINLRGFMHRDLKPGNILLCHCRDCGLSVNEIPGYMLTFKLADFGFARHLQDGMMAVTMCGSPMYMAPEVLMCRRYDAVADIWSMGVIVYQCLANKPPFFANNPEALKNIYETTPYLKPKIPVTTSGALRDLLLRMLVRKPTERIDFETFLKHAFLHQRHFEPPANFKGTPSSATTMNRASRETGAPAAPPAVASGPAIKGLGQGTGDGPFYMTPRPGQCTDRDCTPQRTVLPEDKERRTEPVPQSHLPTYNQSSAAGWANATASPANAKARNPAVANFKVLEDNGEEEAEEEEEGGDDAVSRTTVDEYFEDELASMALPMTEPSRGYIQAVQPHAQRTLTGMPTRVYSPISPTVPSPVGPAVKPSDPLFPGGPGGGTAGLSRSPIYGPASEADQYLPVGNEDQHLCDYVIVNADGSEADRATRRHLLSNANGPPPGSLISRIVANPVAYLMGKHNQVKPLPDVTGTLVNRVLPSARKPVKPDRQREVDAQQQPTPTKPLLSTPPSRVGAMSPGCELQVTPPQSSTPRSSDRAGSSNQGSSPLTVLPTTDDSPTVHFTTGVSPSRQKALLNQVEGSPPCGVPREADRPNLYSGAPFLEYGGNLPGDMLTGGLWAAAEFSDEQLMDPEHNEEIKIITMVLELCELLTELAERRASVLSDCTAATPVAAVQQPPPPTPHSDSPRPGNPTLTEPPVAPSMKFVSEARRIVEQIVLYRRVLYYLDYVFVQVKKAFQQRRLKSTLTARRRLTDSNALYHRCYIRLCQLLRQSRRDDLIEPVGKLLANITANRLIFDYALVQCQAAEIDHYAGDVVQSLQRYKAGITLIHGLRQHAMSNEDKSLLADCMRLLLDRYNHFLTRPSAGRQAEPTVDAVGGGGCGQVPPPPDLVVKTQPDSVPGRPCPSEAVG